MGASCAVVVLHAFDALCLIEVLVPKQKGVVGARQYTGSRKISNFTCSGLFINVAAADVAVSSCCS
jgi:hypothetical protein